MFLVVDPTTQFYVFTDKDPRDDGFHGDVREDVRLDEIGTVADMSLDATVADPCVGRSPSDPNHFKVFLSAKDCRAEGFECVAQVYGHYESWREFQEDP